MQTFKILVVFFICCAISAVFFIPSFNFVAGKAVMCAMNLGCSERSMDVVDILAVFGLFSPLAIFPAGAIFTWKNLADSSKSPFQFTLLALLAVFPLIALAAIPVFVAVVDTASAWSNSASRKRVQKIDKELKSSPLEISVIKARFIEGSGNEENVEFTIQLKNVPQIVHKYKLTLDSLGLKDRINTIYQRETFVYTPVVKAVNKNGKWQFEAYESGKVITTGEDQFVTTIRYFKEKETTGSGKSPEVPDALTMHIECWSDESQVSPGLTLFHHPVPIPGNETGRL